MKTVSTENAELLYQQFNWNRLRFEVLTTVNLLNAIVWEVKPCSLVAVYRRFEETTLSNFSFDEKAKQLFN